MSTKNQAAAARAEKRDTANKIPQAGLNAYGLHIFTCADKPTKNGQTPFTRSFYFLTTGAVRHAIDRNSQKGGVPYVASEKFPNAVECGMVLKGGALSGEIATFAPMTAMYVDGNYATTPDDIPEGALSTVYNLSGSAFPLNTGGLGTRIKASGIIHRSKYGGNRIRAINPLPVLVAAHTNGYIPKTFPPYDAALAREDSAAGGYIRTAPAIIGVFGDELRAALEKQTGQKMLWKLTLNESADNKYEYHKAAQGTNPEVRHARFDGQFWGTQIDEKDPTKSHNFAVNTECYGNRFEELGYSVDTAGGYSLAKEFVLPAMPFMNFAAFMVVKPKKEESLTHNQSTTYKVSMANDLSASEDSDEDEEEIKKKQEELEAVKKDLEEGLPRFARVVTMAKVFFDAATFLNQFCIKITGEYAAAVANESIFKGSLSASEKDIADKAATNGETNTGVVILTIPSATARTIAKNATKKPKEGKQSSRVFYISSRTMMTKLQPQALNEFVNMCNGLSPEKIAENTKDMSPEEAAAYATKFAGLTPAESTSVVQYIVDRAKVPKDPSPSMAAVITHIKNSTLNTATIGVDSMVVFSYKAPKRGDEYELARDVMFGHPATAVAEDENDADDEAEESSKKRKREGSDDEASKKKGKK